MEENGTEVMELDQVNIDALWDGETVTDAVEDQHGGEPEGEADQTREAGTDEGQPAPEAGQDKEGEAEDQGGQTDQTAAQAPESFTLKYMGENVTVDRERLTQLAQQGMDYERVRTERDQLREQRKQSDPVMALVQSFANRSGMTVEQYVDYCRRQEIMSGGVDEATAMAQVEIEKREAAVKEREAAQQEQTVLAQQAEDRQKAVQADMAAFIRAYPDVKAETIPKEVWDAVAAGESLVTAYTMHRNKLLEARVAAQEQNKDNASRTPGSMSTQGERGRTSISDLWDAAGE